ncbi:hypothetical protein A11A3_15597 [Alcanivorax hongdengensis A-11-3]|uniref:DUF3108 domain-containing protein n=1 Tax=Alcanivorax hongdengensis A-11-3 TaxID=1177179 RepID=L0W7W0_9GAMM|nr:hypothetical protein A11A3_15597 [Alcanivorax hongdengensis A-11-3]
MFIRLLASLILLACQSVLADGAFPQTLRPAEAQYRVVVNGIPVGLKATIRLEAVQDHYQLRFLIDNKLFRHEEISQFQWRNCYALPMHYQHASSGFGIERQGDIRFDWQQHLAIGSEGNYSLPEAVTDALGIAMMARCKMARGDESFSYPVAEAEGLTTYQYQTLGTRELETPAGNWHVAGLERDYPEGGRRSRFWAARELDYFMVRMDHQENPFIRGRIEMTDFRYLDSPSPERQEGITSARR